MILFKEFWMNLFLKLLYGSMIIMFEEFLSEYKGMFSP